VGVTDRQLLELAQYRTSDAFDDDERLVLDLAEAMLEPVEISDGAVCALPERRATGPTT